MWHTGQTIREETKQSLYKPCRGVEQVLTGIDNNDLLLYSQRSSRFILFSYLENKTIVKSKVNEKLNPKTVKTFSFKLKRNVNLVKKTVEIQQ